MINNKNSAFTLVELSIVLVIIGLIVSGVLVGQTLIKQAQLKSLMGDVRKFQQAHRIFYLNYDCYAGDCTQQGTWFSGLAYGGYNGNGNNQIDWQPETTVAWQVLSKAGLIAGEYTGDYTGSTLDAGVNIPKCSIPNCGITVQWAYDPPTIYGKTGNRLRFGTAEGCCSAILTTEEAFLIDNKMDDGMPGQGFMMAPENSCTTGAYNDPSGEYNLSRTDIVCTISTDLDKTPGM